MRPCNSANSVTTSVSPSLLIEVDSHSYDAFDTCVDGWYGSTPARNNVTVRYSPSIATMPMPPVYPR